MHTHNSLSQNNNKNFYKEILYWVRGFKINEIIEQCVYIENFKVDYR